MRILIVEDNRDIAGNIADWLEPLGHELDFAGDGLSGLQLAVSRRFDAIVLDLNLPGIDGITLCRRLRSEANDTTPVLMLTARDQLDDKLEGFRAGSDDPDYPNCYFLGIETIRGTGELEYLGNNKWRALYVATTCKTPVAPEIFHSEIGLGEVTIEITPKP